MAVVPANPGGLIAQFDPPFVGENAPWAHPTPRWRQHLLAIGTTSFAVLALALAAICWAVADRHGCSGRAVCVINNNAGLGGLYGVVVAVIGVGITLLIRALDDESNSQRFVRVRRQAAYEAWHNMQHFARSWGRYGQLMNRGDISLDRATELASDPIAQRLSASQAEHVDHMRRNFAVLARLPWNDRSEDAQRHVGWFIEQSLRFVIDVALEDKEAREMIRGFDVRPDQDRDAVMRPLLRLADALAQKGPRWTVRFDFSHRLEDPDAANCHVVCWRCSDTSGPETRHILGASLSGLRDPP